MMNKLLAKKAGILVAGVLATDGLIHAYWTTGNIWPAADMGLLTALGKNSR